MGLLLTLTWGAVPCSHSIFILRSVLWRPLSLLSKMSLLRSHLYCLRFKHPAPTSSSWNLFSRTVDFNSSISALELWLPVETPSVVETPRFILFLFNGLEV